MAVRPASLLILFKATDTEMVVVAVILHQVRILGKRLQIQHEGTTKAYIKASNNSMSWVL